MRYQATLALFNRRTLALAFAGIASGLPLALTGSTLQAWFTVSGINLMTIGMLSLVGQAYIYKFLWAPLLDRFVPFNLGRRRSWILLMQLCLVLSIAAMGLMDPKHTTWELAAIALLVAFFSSTQDTAIDAYRTDLLPSSERGIGASMYILGYRIAIIVSGALALVLAAEFGWRITYFVMAGIMCANMIVTYYSPNPAHEHPGPTTLAKAVVEPWKELLTRQNAIAIVVFIITYKICDAFALSLNTTFLLRGVGFSLVEVGTISKTVSLVASLIGSVLGGVLLPRLGLYRSLMIFGFLQMASNLSFAVLAIVGKSLGWMAFSLFADYFSGGLSGVAFIVFLTSLCNTRFSATQYALLSALMAVGRVFVGPAAAGMVDHMGWAQFYVWTFFMGLPALGILWWLNRQFDFGATFLARTAV